MGKEATIKDKVAGGLFWGGISNGLQQLLNLLFGIIVARILSPGDYGMVGMLAIFSSIASALQESGLTASLINQKEIDNKDYDTVLWFSVCISLLIYAVLWCAAPLIAKYFHTYELISLSRFSFLSIIISSVGVASSAYLTKLLMVKQKAISAIIALIISGIVGIIMAKNGMSYWGIAAQNITYCLIVVSLQWWFSPYKPSLFFSFQKLKNLISFGIILLATRIFNIINYNLFSVVFGRLFTKVEVGNYSQANKWNSMGYSTISNMIYGVEQPAMVEVSNEPERLLKVLRKIIRFTSFISFPTMLGLAFVSSEFITITLSEKWIESAYLLKILCIAGAFLPLSDVFSCFLVSQKKGYYYMFSTIILGACQILAVLFLKNQGVNMMVTISTAINIAWVLVWYVLVRKTIKYKLIHFLKDFVPFLAITIFVLAATFFCTKSMSNIYFLFITKVLVAITIYIVIMMLVRPVIFVECISYFRKKNGRFINNYR